MQSRTVGFYAGIDPTAPSLHLGHLLPMMILFWLFNHGHNVVSLVGGGTARLGDPSGRLTSRERTAESVQKHNAMAMFSQLENLWENASRYSERHGYDRGCGGKKELLNNAVWLEKLNVLEFAKKLGDGMRLGTMLGRDT